MTTDEIKENLKSMSLGDHLEELRIRMILALAGLILGMVVCLFFGKHLIAFLERPYHQAIVTQSYVPDLNEAPETDIQNADDTTRPPGLVGLQTRRPAEGFLTYIKICLVFGLLLSSPWVFWQVWSFISAGLYGHEKKFVKAVVPISAALFVIGALFFLFEVAPLTMKFFIRFNEILSLSSFWMFEDYINMILVLMLVFALAFQMPIAIVFAEKMGLVSIDKLITARRYVAVVLIILAAMATPPDVVSQIGLFIPMYILYESSIIACRMMRQKKTHSPE